MQFGEGFGTTQKVNSEVGQGANTLVGQTVFADVFQNAINDVITTEDEYQKAKYMLATGQTDDAHTEPIAGAKAQLSVDLLVQLRNKALEAYNEIMRINL
ncbi:flagellar hook-basal body complex protein FliE [Clostridium sp. ASF356]|nr:flagellar hook-basal body complex protein FliE [Clostridium sp. MD294]NDO46387.1 flagellar hook-basal body complex protein FliE [Clostridium sp. MD294]